MAYKLVLILSLVAISWHAHGEQQASETESNENPEEEVGKSDTQKIKPKKRKARRKSFRIGFDYNTSVAYSDNKFEDAPSGTTLIETEAYMSASKKLDQNLSFDAYINLISESERFVDSIDRALLSQSIGSHMTLGIGRDYLNVGGFESKANPTQTEVRSYYSRYHLAFQDINQTRSADNIQLTLHPTWLGQLQIQIINDVLTDPDTDDNDWDYFNDQARQPATIIEWQASLAGFTPLLQVSSYDINHSFYLGAGLMAALGNFNSYIDYIYDKRAFRDETREEHHTFKTLTARVEYDFGPVIPFAKFSQLQTEQSDLDRTTNTSHDSFDDNGSAYTLGLSFANQRLKGALRPYMYYTVSSQDISSNPRDPLESEHKQQSEFLLGVRGRL